MLCGEEFIWRIKEMLNEFKPVLNNGNNITTITSDQTSLDTQNNESKDTDY